MIIDCHGHFTTAPPPLQEFRDAQLAGLAGGPPTEPPPAHISDDAIRERIEQGQLRLLRERGGDLTIFSPRAAGMEHHIRDLPAAQSWARTCNDLIHRVVQLYPDHFAGACQLPQTPDHPIETSLDELDRCVGELGFVGCILNPDPSGGGWSATPVTDPSWYPLYERMVELDVPAMIHVSASCSPAVHHTGAYYLGADTTVFMQLIQGDLFREFPTLRFVIPHGGGAVPYHWGRYRGLADRLNRPPIEEHVMRNVFFDTCVYHQAGVALLFEVAGIDNLLFGSELLGAVRGADPDTGVDWDDTKHYIDNLGLTEADRRQVFECNARRVYPRLDAHLRARQR